jgi:hypothetical protein
MLVLANKCALDVSWLQRRNIGILAHARLRSGIRYAVFAKSDLFSLGVAKYASCAAALDRIVRMRCCLRDMELSTAYACKHAHRHLLA